MAKKTTWTEGGRTPDTCAACGWDKSRWHSQCGDELVCLASVVYVFTSVDSHDVALAAASIEHLKTYTLACDAKLRLLDRTATGDDDWSHSYAWSEKFNPPSHVLAMDGWAPQYSTTIKDMRTALEFFQRGWRARDKQPSPSPVKKTRGRVKISP